MTNQIWTLNSLKSDLNYRKVPVKQFFDQRTVKYDSDYRIARLIQVPLKTSVLVKTLQYIQEEWNSIPQCKRFSYSGSHLTRIVFGKNRVRTKWMILCCRNNQQLRDVWQGSALRCLTEILDVCQDAKYASEEELQKSASVSAKFRHPEGS